MAHILHGQLVSGGSAVDASGDVAERSIAEAQKSVGHGVYFCQLGKVHREILKFGEMVKAFCLGFENVLSPKSDNGEAFGTSTHAIKCKREFGLHPCDCGVRAHHCICQGFHLGAGVGQERRTSRAKKATAATRMIVDFLRSQWLIAV